MTSKYLFTSCSLADLFAKINYILGVGMNKIRFGALLILSTLLGACVTSITMNSPAIPATIVAGENGPEQVYWTYADSLPKDKDDWRAHVEENESPLPLPVHLLASERQYLWIVPVCNGSVRWDKAEPHQMAPDEMTARVEC